MKRFQVVPYRVFVRDDGMRASIHGAVPWTSAAEKLRWTVQEQGFTLYNSYENTYVIGRPPFTTRAEADQVCARLNGWDPD